MARAAVIERLSSKLATVLDLFDASALGLLSHYLYGPLATLLINFFRALF